MRQQESDVGRFWCAKLFVLILAGIFLAGCSFQTVKSQAFSKLDRLESELRRGVSSKADVLTVLGEPDGSGGAIFPSASHGSDVWYYEASRSKISGVEQNILLVFFEGQAFDGFMWFSNKAEVRTP